MSEFPQPKAKQLTKKQRDELVKSAFACERQIKDGVRKVFESTWAFAEALYEMDEEQYWQVLEYGTLEEFLGQPDIGMSRSWFNRLVSGWRQFVVVNNVAPAQLAPIPPTKVAEVLPAVRRGDVKPEKALADAESLSKTDLREEYRTYSGNHNAAGQLPASPGLDATAEPERVKCPTCGSWVVKDVIEGTAVPK